MTTQQFLSKLGTTNVTVWTVRQASYRLDPSAFLDREAKRIEKERLNVNQTEMSERTKIIEESLNDISRLVSDAIVFGGSAEQIRRAVIDGVLDAMDYESAGPFANEIVNREYR